MSNDMVFCRACGGALHISAPFCPHCGAPQHPEQHPEPQGDGVPRGFGNAIAICFRKYVTFSGRAPRAEFWWFTLFYALVQWGAAVLAGVSDMPDAGNVLEGVVSLVCFCPSISVGVRRLHDTDRSGWWMWVILVPFVGWIFLLIWYCTRGTPGPNRFGPENGIA